jgi:hypothetical protein
MAQAVHSVGRRNLMTRENWQALLFAVILLALCFVQ